MPWQPAAILYPDAELLLTGAFRAALLAAGEPDVYVGREIPSKRRDRMVILTRDGGASDGLYDNPRIRCTAWDTTDQKAIDLARLVVALSPRLVLNGTVKRAQHLSGPFEVAEPQPCQYLLFEFQTKGVPL